MEVSLPSTASKREMDSHHPNILIPPATGGQAHRGASLIEILISFALLSILILPIMLILGNASKNNILSYITNSRSMLIGSVVDGLDADDPTFVQDEDMGSTSQTITDANTPIPYLLKVDTSNSVSDSLKHRVYLYVYKAVGDALSSPFYTSTQDIRTDRIYMDVGNTTSSKVDDNQQVWVPDVATDSAANSGKLVPGYITANAGSTGTSSNITLTSGSSTNMLTILGSYRQAANTSTALEYTLYLDTGSYLVQLYFVEMDNTVNTSVGHRRAMDIFMDDDTFANTLAGTAEKTSFSPYSSAGYKNPVILSFIKTVGANKYLNIAIKGAAAGTDLAPQLSGLSVQRIY